MPGRRTPTHRGGTPIGGDTPAAVGSLVLSDSAFTLNVNAGETTEFTDPSYLLTLSNGGPGNWRNPQYSISLSFGSGWLTLVPENVAGSFVFTMTVNATALSAGTYTATITFTDAKVSNSGQDVVVTVVVVEQVPAILLNPVSLDFSIVDETVTGSSKDVTVSNATGVGTLATPSIGTITGAGAAYIDSVDVVGPSGGPFTITVTPTAVGGTPGGPYVASIPIASPGAQNTPVTLTANITVASSQTAVIGLTRTLDDAQFTIGGANPSDQSVGFVNAGAGSFAGVSIQSTSYSGVASGWATASIASSILTVAINTTGIVTEGFSTLDVVLEDANAASTATYTVFLKSQNAVLSPVLSVSPGAIGVTIDNGTTPQDRTITIQNVNGSLADLGTIGVAFSPGVAWVSVASVVNGLATLTFSTASLANGTYNTSVVVSAPNATNSPITVPLTLTVQAPQTPGTFLPPPWTLPTTATHDTNTDVITYDPFSSPADTTGFA